MAKFSRGQPVLPGAQSVNLFAGLAKPADEDAPPSVFLAEYDDKIQIHCYEIQSQNVLTKDDAWGCAESSTELSLNATRVR